VARALDLAASSTSTSTVALIDFLDNLSDVTNQLPTALSLIAPEELTAMYTAAFAGMEAQGNRFLKRANEMARGLPRFVHQRVQSLPDGQRRSRATAG